MVRKKAFFEVRGGFYKLGHKFLTVLREEKSHANITAHFFQK